MRMYQKRKVFRSLCKTHKHPDGGVSWAKVADELRKLPYHKTLFRNTNKTCDKCGK